MLFHSSIEPLYYLLPLIGFVVGLFGTMLGGGGGFFFLPVLVLLLNVDPKTAVITSLVASLPICIVGSWGHYRRKNINFKIAAIFAVAGIIGAFLGTAVTGRISSEQLKISFGIYSVLIALNIVLTTRNKQPKNENGAETAKKSKLATTTKGSFFGFFAGMITGTFGTSGTAPVLSGLFSLNLPLKTVIGTSLLVVLINTLFAVGSHLLTGKTDLTLVWFLTAGSTIGALTGPRILAKTETGNSENKIKYWYAAAMVLIGVLMIINK
jgi:uncharacterized membrane protein YfcA